MRGKFEWCFKDRDESKMNGFPRNRPIRRALRIVKHANSARIWIFHLARGGVPNYGRAAHQPTRPESSRNVTAFVSSLAHRGLRQARQPKACRRKMESVMLGYRSAARDAKNAAKAARKPATAARTKRGNR